MYLTLLNIHSYFRWIVLFSLTLSTLLAVRGWKMNNAFTISMNSIRHWTTTIAQIQLILGIALYSISPLVAYFISNFNKAIHLREIRFFGMEHSSMMIVAVAILTLGSMKTKRKINDFDKYKTMAIYFSIALLIILANIPWSFSPLTSRPNFRPY